MLLGVLALDFAQYIRDDAMASVNFADETRGYYVALAGMNRALYEMAQAKAAGPAGTVNGVNGVNAQQQQLQQQQQQQQRQAKVGLDDQAERQIECCDKWNEGDFAGSRWSVRISDEGARIAINALRTNSPEDEAFLHYIVQNLVRSGNKTTGVDRRMEKTID